MMKWIAIAVLAMTTILAHSDDDELLRAAKDACALLPAVSGAGVTGQKCDRPLPAPSRPEGDIDGDFISKFSCKDLFSEKVPMKFFKESGPLDWNMVNHWAPFCSISNFTYKKTYYAANAPKTPLKKIQKDWVNYEIGLDQCVLKPNQLRFNSNYVSATRKAQNVRVGTDAERKAFLDGINSEGGVRERVKNFCCKDDNADCKRLMDEVKVQFCKPKESVDGLCDAPDGTKKSCDEVPDPCTDVSTVYTMTQEDFSDLSKAIDSVKAAPEIAGKFPMKAGYVQVSNLFQHNGAMKEGLGTLEHEFGHACSAIRRQIEVNKGDPANYKDMIDVRSQYDIEGKPISGCYMSQNASRVFKALWDSTLPDPKDPNVYQCFDDLAKSGSRTKYSKPQKPCTNGCPRSHVEEAFADWIKLQANIETGLAWETFRHSCTYLRENLHPQGQDVIRCALKSKEFKEKAKKVVRCAQ